MASWWKYVNSTPRFAHGLKQGAQIFTYVFSLNAQQPDNARQLRTDRTGGWYTRDFGPNERIFVRRITTEGWVRSDCNAASEHSLLCGGYIAGPHSSPDTDFHG